eukprot:gene64796-88648_t
MTVMRLGGTVVMMRHFDPEAALAAIERYHVNASQWVPTHFVRMLKLPEEPQGRDPCREPDAPSDSASPFAAPTWGDEAIRPLTEPAVPLAAARIEAETTLAAAAKLLVSLLGEIQARPPLPHGGKIVTAQP